MKKFKFNFLLRALVFSLILTGLSFATLSANAADATKAQQLRDGILRAKQQVDRAIAAGGGRSPLWENGLEENDALALPIFIQASTSLGNAATLADASLAAFLSFNIALGNFRFAQSCNRMGLSRSQISRANFAAIQPPVGFLAAFSPDITNTVSELLALKATVGCP